MDIRVLRYNENFGGESEDMQVFGEVSGERGVGLDSMQ